MDHHKLEAYQIARVFCKDVRHIIRIRNLELSLADQLSRASMSILLNLSEGCGRATAKDKRKFYFIARGSLYETSAILDHLSDLNMISQDQYDKLQLTQSQLARMIFGLIRGAKSIHLR